MSLSVSLVFQGLLKEGTSPEKLVKFGYLAGNCIVLNEAMEKIKKTKHHERKEISMDKRSSMADRICS